MVYVKGGTSILWVITFIISAVVIYYFFVRNGKLQDFFSNLLKTDNTGGDGTTTPPPQGGGGSTATGNHVYQSTGNTCSGKDGSQTINCSDGSTHSERHDFDSCGITNIEATGIIQLKAGDHCGCGGGDEFTVKLMGPKHSDGNCCWWLLAVYQNGNIRSGGEGDHPDTEKDSTDGVIKQNVGSLEGKKVGVKGVSWDNGNGTRHFEGWVDVTGTGTSWEKVVQQDLSEWGDKKKTGTPASDQQVEFRIDCDNAKWVANDIIEIQPGVLASGGGSDSGSGPITPAQPATSGIAYARYSLRDFTYSAYQSRSRRKHMYSDMGRLHRKTTRIGNLV